jgi:hypothetical protein
MKALPMYAILLLIVAFALLGPLRFLCAAVFWACLAVGGFLFLAGGCGLAPWLFRAVAAAAFILIVHPPAAPAATQYQTVPGPDTRWLMRKR